MTSIAARAAPSVTQSLADIIAWRIVLIGIAFFPTAIAGASAPTASFANPGITVTLRRLPIMERMPGMQLLGESGPADPGRGNRSRG
ncbi:MAG: hypothetical protein ACYCZX_16760 [Rhodospirillaceae bacterium]